jgi:hypothetical protein
MFPDCQYAVSQDHLNICGVRHSHALSRFQTSLAGEGEHIVFSANFYLMAEAESASDI